MRDAGSLEFVDGWIGLILSMSSPSPKATGYTTLESKDFYRLPGVLTPSPE